MYSENCQTILDFCSVQTEWNACNRFRLGPSSQRELLEINMTNILIWITLGLVLTKSCTSTIPDFEPPIAHHLNSSSDHLSWSSDTPVPKFSEYIRVTDEAVPNIESLLAKYYSTNGQVNHRRENTHFPDLESHQKKHGHQSVESRYNYQSQPYLDHQFMHSPPEYDAIFLKKHDYMGENNYGGGGWDMFPGGQNSGYGSGLAQVGQVVKKGKEAKALFALMAPLILLAVFGPLLATQTMIPWIANGGLSTVTTIAGSGKRRKRSPRDPRQLAELEKRLQLFLAVQDFIARSGSTDFAEKIGEAFLKCQKYTERRNKCPERIACEYIDETSAMDPAERRIAKMVFQNVMSNPMIPATIKERLGKGFMYGRSHKGHCQNYWCETVDGPRRTVNHT